MFDYVQPAGAVVPVFGLAAGLGCDADVGFFDLTCFVFRQQPDAQFFRFGAVAQTQDHGRVFMQAPDPEVARLVHPVITGKEDAHIVAGVQPFRPFFRFDKADLGIGRADDPGQFFRHSAVKFTLMLFPENFRIGEPGQYVAQDPDREFEQHFFAL